jgi:opacity protein-like surface antigen
VFLDYMASDMISLGVNLDYHATSAENAIADTIGAEDIDFTVLSYGVNGALFFTSEGTAKPYVKVGVGAYSVKAEVKGGPFDGQNLFDETKLGFSGGAGVMFRPAGSSIGFGIEGMFHNVTDAVEDFNGQPSAAQFITATARISFSFSDMTQTP